MKKLLLMNAFICFLAATTNAQWSEPSQDDLVIRGGWLFDGISDDRRKNSGIVIRDGKIVAVDADLQNKVLSATST